ncbi:lysozyme inhibitor LprI family protein [Pseudochelatococcus sp. B33]
MRSFFRPTFAISVFLAVTAAPAAADDLYDQCLEKSDGTNTAWAQCGGEWIAREDAKLNKTWHQVYGQTDGQTKSDLLAEQRLWNTYKESSCNFYANGDWGREGAGAELRRMPRGGDRRADRRVAGIRPVLFTEMRRARFRFVVFHA